MDPRRQPGRQRSVHLEGMGSNSRITVEKNPRYWDAARVRLNRIYNKSNYHMMELLRRTAATGHLPPAAPPQPYFERLYKTPTVKEQFEYMGSIGWTLLRNGFNRFVRGRKFRWGIAYGYSDWKDLVMWRGIKIKNPPGHFLADPFVIRDGERDYCFLEDYDFKTNRARISVYELKRSGAARLGDAIVEPYHLSFPYLFEYQGKLYMCPETSENNEIRLYECVNFPLEWKHSKTLMTNVSAVDTLIFPHDGLWWMLTNIDPSNTNGHYAEMFIFYSDNPLGTEWHPHAGNPVIIDSAKGRNGRNPVR